MLKKIIFMGTPIFAVPILKSLYQNGYPVSVVYSQPPKKSSRGMKTQKSPVHLMAETLNIEARTPDVLKGNSIEENFLKKLDADLAIVVAYGKLLPESFLNLTKKGFINIHASILPSWRGAAPIQRAIINLDKKTGISVMKINNKLDSGPVCNKYEIEIKKQDNSETISEKLSLIASEKILDEIDNIIDGKANFIEQEHDKATYANKIEKTEGKINWNIKAEEILGLINGLFPSPGAWFTFKGERYKILKAEVGNSKGEPGIVLGENLEIGCKEGSLKITEIQREGKKVQKIGEFLLGSRIKKGSNLNNV
jgi:methionyl-tRNA formyltransferase